MNAKEPIVESNFGYTVSYSDARKMWEAGEFSDWVDNNGGFPVTVDGKLYYTWEKLEDALSDNSWD